MWLKFKSSTTAMETTLNAAAAINQPTLRVVAQRQRAFVPALSLEVVIKQLILYKNC